ncbi:hypothetical protein JTE90_004252 [Oedothorax gibbosus]|uniref:Uncharacterized protein n=1 Tax=Oedothorax gibbosus TaxID=931172 RepID=A0AAV6UFL3_9ARAC|nr:hypothetical protein JTE90_004252 [Oedothorax gibbosus]
MRSLRRWQEIACFPVYTFQIEESSEFLEDSSAANQDSTGKRSRDVHHSTLALLWDRDHFDRAVVRCSMFGLKWKRGCEKAF